MAVPSGLLQRLWETLVYSASFPLVQWWRHHRPPSSLVLGSACALHVQHFSSQISSATMCSWTRPHLLFLQTCRYALYAKSNSGPGPSARIQISVSQPLVSSPHVLILLSVRVLHNPHWIIELGPGLYSASIVIIGFCLLVVQACKGSPLGTYFDMYVPAKHQARKYKTQTCWCNAILWILTYPNNAELAWHCLQVLHTVACKWQLHIRRMRCSVDSSRQREDYSSAADLGLRSYCYLYLRTCREFLGKNYATADTVQLFCGLFKVARTSIFKPSQYISKLSQSSP